MREVRAKNRLKQREPLKFFIENSERARALLDRPGLRRMLEKMAVLEGVELTGQEPASSVSFISGTEQCFVVVEKAIDLEAERARLEKELEHARKFVAGIERKLANEKFVQNAPAPVVERERKKLADGKERIKILEEALQRLGS